MLARIPKRSQMALGPVDDLAYQAACFERAAPSGHTPALRGVLPVSAELPRGALLVEDIVGRPATLPRDLAAIAAALARIHSLPLPPPAERPPLHDAADPLRALLAEIEAQAADLGAAGLARRVRDAIDAGIERLRELCRGRSRPEKALIAFDAHPGNFILRADGQAVLVDLEKCRYSYPPLDLAHATLYTSTSWDLDHRATLAPTEVAAAYAAWAGSLGRGAAAWCDWHLPLRRAMWLWSVTWCAQWRVAATGPAATRAADDDGPTAGSTAALVAHVRERVDHYLSPEGVERVQAELDALVDRLPRRDLAAEAGR